MKKLITLLALVFCLNGKAQTPILHLSADSTCVGHCIIYRDSTITTKPCTYTWIFNGAESPNGHIYPSAGYTISGDTVTCVLTATSTPFPPSIKVCYYVNSFLNENDTTHHVYGYYNVTEIIQNGLGQTSSLTDSVRVALGPVAHAHLSSSACIGGVINLSSSSSYTAEASTYSWVGPNGFTSTMQNPIISNVSTLNSGQYTLTITELAGGCMGEDTTSVNVTNCLGINEITNISSQPDIYPNPSNGSFKVSLPHSGGEALNIKMYDVMGNEITPLLISQKGEDAAIEAGSLSNGVYFISVSGGEQSIVKKVIVQR